MRTKFKAWKKTNGPEMFEDIRAIDFEKNIIRIGYKLSEYTTRIDEESLDNVELLQSTGLFDKNGNEIYAGHVVKFKNPYDKRFTAIGVVVWREDKACFGIDMEGTTEQFELYRVTVENYLTVIGNIYQDEHLLERDK